MNNEKVCLACLEKIVNDEKFLLCSVCKNVYHLGQACAGVNEASYASMGSAKRDKWRCKTCRTQESRSGPHSGACSSQNSSDESQSAVSAQLQSFGLKLDSLLAMKRSVDTLLSLPAKVDELLTLKPTVERLEAHIQELDSKVDGLSANYNSVLESAAENGNKICTLERQHAELQETVSGQAETIQSLREEINNGEQYSRRANLEIHGLPPASDEDLRKAVNDLAVQLGISDFATSDILAVHRLPAKPGFTPIVLIKFKSTETKDRWLGARGKLRTLVAAAVVPQLYINENLTKLNRQLFWLAKEKAKENQYKFAWVKRGKVFVKKDESSSLLRVDRVADLDKIV